jgi:uncharacterized protein (TIGR02996 family)
MTQEDAFLLDILENHEDDTPRRVFADWLLDLPDAVSAARGEFIHVQCDLARIPAGTPRPDHLVQRERELLDMHSREWGSLFQRLGCTCWEYRRGFVEGVGLSASSLLSQASFLFRSAPIRELKLYDSAGRWQELASCPYLARVQTLDLEKNDLGDADIESLAQSAHLGELSTLLVWLNQVADGGLRALTQARLPRLVRLDLSSNLIADPGAALLAQSPLLGQLTMLDLTANQVTDFGALALVSSPHTARLGLLELAKNPISLAAQNTLRERFAGRVHVWG